LKDFHADNFFIEVEPTIFKLADENDFRYLSMRVKSGSEADAHEVLQKQWAHLFPEIPFQGGYQEDVWSDFYTSVDRSQTFNLVLASIAVMLACLGLYGLVTLNVSGRVKEFSIRKTLGAGLKNIGSIIINQYLLLVMIAILIGAPISYIFAKAYLNMLFAYPMPLGYSGIVVSVIILMVVLLAVISTQIRRVLKTNPIEGLKVD
jgi:ABC-type antimicrobial peptide transport system permease subunit